MSGTTVTLRPNASAFDAAVWTVVGAGDAQTALSDNSDASYVKNAVPGAGVHSTILVASLGTSALPSLSQIRTVTARIRYNNPTGSKQLNFDLYVPGMGAKPTEGASPSAGIVTIAGVAWNTRPDNAPWTQADIDALQVELDEFNAYSNADYIRVYEVYADVLYNEAPTATVTGPADPEATTQTPAVTWTYADAELDAQERAKVKVFSAAQYGAAGFDPESSAPVWSSGELLTSATSVTVGTTLPNSTTYRAYVKVADVGSGGRYGPWAYKQFVLSTTVVPQPDQPVVVDVVATAREIISMSSAVTSPTSDSFIIERSEDGGATWVAIDPDLDPAIVSVALRVRAAQATGAQTLQATVTDASGSAIYTPYTPTAVITTHLFTAASGDALGNPWTLADLAALQVALAIPTAVSDDMRVYEVYLDVTYAGGVVNTIRPNAIVAAGGWQNAAGGAPSAADLADAGNDATYAKANAAVGSLTLGFPTPLVYTDYTAPRDTPVMYRLIGVHDAGGGVFLHSVPSVAATITPAFTCGWLKDPADPTRNIAVVYETHELPSVTPERVTFHEALGRDDPVVVYDVIQTEEMAFPLFFHSDAEWAAFKLLRSGQRTLLAQPPWGDAGSEQFYVRLGRDLSKTLITTDDQRRNQRRRVTIAARVVPAP